MSLVCYTNINTNLLGLMMILCSWILFYDLRAFLVQNLPYYKEIVLGVAGKLSVLPLVDWARKWPKTASLKE